MCIVRGYAHLYNQGHFRAKPKVVYQRLFPPAFAWFRHLFFLPNAQNMNQSICMILYIPSHCETSEKFLYFRVSLYNVCTTQWPISFCCIYHKCLRRRELNFLLYGQSGELFRVGQSAK